MKLLLDNKLFKLCFALLLLHISTLHTNSRKDKNKSAFSSYEHRRSILKNKILPKYKFSTNKNEWGGGSIFYLDRHNISCANSQALQGFHFKHGNNMMNYEYACSSSLTAVLDKKEIKYTNFNIIGGDEVRSANYLDRHDVMCKPGFALKGFFLKRDHKLNDIAYEFYCIAVNCVDQKTEETNPTPNTDHRLESLAYQEIILRNDRVLVEFRLISDEITKQFK